MNEVKVRVLTEEKALRLACGDLFLLPQVAERLGVRDSRLRYAHSAGLPLPVRKIGKHYIYSEEDVASAKAWFTKL
jgi:hypothetical protein